MTPDSKKLAPLTEEAVSLLKGLAHPARLLICCQLRDREMSVGEIEAILDIRQPRLSRELGKLREEGLVETRRESKVVFYRLSQRGRVTAMIDAICGVMLNRAPPRPVSTETSGPRRKPNRAGGYGVFARTGSSA